MSPNSSASDHTDPRRESALVDTANWLTGAVAKAREAAAGPRTGIITPLAFHVEFAVNSQNDAVSVALANGRVSVTSQAADDSGPLTLGVRWSSGFTAAGLVKGKSLGEWTVDSVADGRAELTHRSLDRGSRGADLPEILLVKPAAPEASDEVSVRLAGTSDYCSDWLIRGWARK
jgi:hypothetical protein